MTYKDVYDKLSIALIDDANNSISNYVENVKVKLNLNLKKLLQIILMVDNGEIYGMYKNDSLLNCFKPTLAYFAKNINTNNLYLFSTDTLSITRFLVKNENHIEIYFTKEEFLKKIDDTIKYYSEHLEGLRMKLEKFYSEYSFTKRKKIYHNLARYEYKIEKLRKLKEEIGLD